MKLTVDLTKDNSFRVKSGNNVYLCEPLVESAGRNGGMNPEEMFIASLGTSVVAAAVNFCEERGLSPAGMKVGMDWEFGNGSTRISHIHVNIRHPDSVGSTHEDDFMSAIHECDIYQTLLNKPDIHFHASPDNDKPEGEVLVHFVGAE